MKKGSSCFFVVILTLVVLLISVATGFAATPDLKIGSNKVGSTWYVQAACIADVVKKAFPDIKIDVAPIAGGIGNLKLLGQEKMHIALTMDNNNL